MSILDRLFGRRREVSAGGGAHSAGGPSIGHRIQYPGRGLGRVERLEDREGVPHVVLRMDSGAGLAVPLGSVETIWRLPPPEEARRLLERLLQPSAPDSRPFEQRVVAFAAVMENGTREDQVDAYRRWLADGPPRSFGERKRLQVLEENVVRPLAEALGEDEAALRARVRAAHGVSSR